MEINKYECSFYGLFYSIFLKTALRAHQNSRMWYVLCIRKCFVSTLSKKEEKAFGADFFFFSEMIYYKNTPPRTTNINILKIILAYLILIW